AGPAAPPDDLGRPRRGRGPRWPPPTRSPPRDPSPVPPSDLNTKEVGASPLPRHSPVLVAGVSIAAPSRGFHKDARLRPNRDNLPYTANPRSRANSSL